MLSFVRFIWYAMQMRRSYYAAEKAEDEENTFQFLRKARRSGRAALQIQSPLISQKIRAAMTKGLVAIHGLYQRGVIARIPEEDLELVASALKVLNGWAVMEIQPNISQITAVISVFEDAKSSVKDVDFNKIYDGKNAFAPIRNIMQSFFAGEATREETEKRLDACAGKLRKWLPELILFPEESPPQ